MSLMKMSNLSLMTYGALGLTGVALAVASLYETSDKGSSSKEKMLTHLKKKNQPNLLQVCLPQKINQPKH